CRFNAVSLDRDSRHNSPDASEHFTPDLPGIVPSTPRVGHLGARKCPADGIHYLTTHRFTLATKHGRFLRETRSPHCWLLRASGHVAVTPSSVMNSRLPMWPVMLPSLGGMPSQTILHRYSIIRVTRTLAARHFLGVRHPAGFCPRL